MGSHYQVEIQHQTARAGLLVGAALDAGPDIHLLGIAALIGSHRQWRSWFLEATVGVGVEGDRIYVQGTTLINSSMSGVISENTVSTQMQPVLYARAIGTIGRPLNDDLDVVARLGLHVTPTGFITDFVSATVGLRLRLP